MNGKVKCGCMPPSKRATNKENNGKDGSLKISTEIFACDLY
jgi:hypothetical protein